MSANQDESEGGRLYWGGMPTDPEIKELMKLKLEEGDLIPHDIVEEIVGKDHLSRRYQTVTKRWRRKLLREQNVDLDAVPDVGFRVLTPDERVQRGIRDSEVSVRGYGRAVNRVLRADPKRLSQAERRQQEFAGRVLRQYLEDGRRNNRQIAIVRELRVLPRSKPPKDEGGK